MKIDELIEELEQVREEHGNLELQIHENHYGTGRGPINYFSANKYVTKEAKKVIVLNLNNP